jgi:hypothetical protein
MKSRHIILTAAAMLLTTGCSVGNIDISKKETTEATLGQPIEENVNGTISGSDTAENNGGDSLLRPNVPYSEVPATAELGERFCVIGPVNSGHLYLTINKCELYDSLNDAGMKYDELMKALIVDGFNYDAETTGFLKGFIMIKTYMTVENVDAVSRDHIWSPEYFDEYDFSLGRFGGVDYATGEYFDQALPPDESLPFYYYFKINLQPGEKKDIIVGYLLDTRKVALEDVTFANGSDDDSFPDELPFTVVNLGLGGDNK